MKKREKEFIALIVLSHAKENTLLLKAQQLHVNRGSYKKSFLNVKQEGEKDGMA
ncbi:MAG: hypothetical protein ACTSPB_00420 [Candidatus Thorarchaeota archaeon]